MRISRYGGGFGDGGKKDRDRKAAFRRKHSIGQRVKGVMLRWEIPGYAWVRVGGEEMLARIETKPEPGQTLLFLVEQLIPDIVLKGLHGAAAVAGGGLSDLAQDFFTARAHLESLVRVSLESAPAGIIERLQTPATAQEGYLAMVKAVLEAHEAYADVQNHLAAVNQALLQRGAGELHYWPWLLPRAREMEALFPPADAENKGAQGGLSEVLMAFYYEQYGHVQLRALLRPAGADGGATARYRLFLDRQELADELAEAISPRLSAQLGADAQCLGVSPVPAGPPTVLAALLAMESGQVYRGFKASV